MTLGLESTHLELSMSLTSPKNVLKHNCFSMSQRVSVLRTFIHLVSFKEIISMFISVICFLKLIVVYVSLAYVCGEKSGLLREKPFAMEEIRNEAGHQLDINFEMELMKKRLKELHDQDCSDEDITLSMKELGMER